MTRARSCYRLGDSIRAACFAMLKEDTKTAREIGEELGISPASVYGVRKAAGLPIANRGGSRKRRPEQSRKGLPTCKCGLLLPCTCGGKPRRAEDYLGRRGEQVIASFGW